MNMKNLLFTLTLILFCALSMSLNGQALSVTITNINHVMCNGGNTGSATATPEGGSPGYSYAWSNGSNMQTATNLAAGMYTVTVTDIQMASATASVNITQPTAIIFQPATIVNVSCFGGNDGVITANPIGGMPPFEYDWSNGGTTKTINILSAGSYTVTVTDVNGCTKMATYNVTQPQPITINLVNLQHESCEDENDGAIAISVTGGVGPYLVEWSTGDMGFTITDLEPGMYMATVTDNHDCTSSAAFTINAGADVNIILVSLTHVTCPGGNNGTIAIMGSGGPGPFTYAWSNGGSVPIVTNLPAGIYTVTVTNPNGCTAVASYTVNQPPPNNLTITQNGMNLCYGDQNVDLMAVPGGGTPPYTGLWSNGVQGLVNMNLGAGMYMVTVTDAFGCTDSITHIVTQPPPFNININASGTNLCFGDQNVDLMAVPGGGTPPYTGLWSNGVQGLVNMNLGAGIYMVTVTDANECTATQAHVITQPPPLHINITSTTETAAGANNGTLTVVPIGGSPGYTFLWSNGGTTSMITGLAPGSYTVTVTDVNGCTVTKTSVVNVFGCSINAFFQIPDHLICENDTIDLMPTVTTEDPPVSYLWSVGSTENHLVVSSGGEYCVSVQDASNCQASICAIVTEIIIPPFMCPVTNESAPNANDGAVNCDSMPGLTYQWNNGATTPSISQLTPGQYCLTVTDGNGCTSVVYYNVQPGNSQPVRNVILIIADDLGTDYLGFYEDYVDTAAMPNVRRLLSRGVRFTNAMSNPLCSPTRAGILTGRYSFRTGVGEAIPMSGGGSLDTSEKTIPGLLKDYSSSINTANIGKWHLNPETPATNLQIPNLIGYDYYAGSFSGALDDYFEWDKVTNGVPTTDSTYATTEYANDAINWVKGLDSNPFFLWLAFNAPHTPLHLPPGDLHSYTTLSGTTPDINAQPKEYFKAMLEALDHEIGRLFDSLIVFNKWDSTDIIFIGDNGNAQAVSQITDASRAKGTIYQYGVHVPFIISGPSVDNPGRVSQALVNTQDLFPTILDMMGDTGWEAEIPVTSPVDGVSILPILKNLSGDIRSWVFTEVFKESPDAKDGKAMRNMDYKLLNFDLDDYQEFYHLSSDPSELTDLLTGTLTSVEIENYNYLCSEMTDLVGAGSYCNSAVGINGVYADQSFEVFPNPFSTSITIIFSNEQLNSTLRIIDILGRQVKTISFSGKQLTMEKDEMKDGIYFLQISDRKGSIATRRIILSSR